jgi:hypothetical protein
MVLMFEALGPSPELREHFGAFHERLHALGCAWVRAGVERGSLRVDLDVEASVEMLMSTFTGVRAHSLLMGPRVDRERVYATLLGMLRAGVEDGARASTRGGER